MKLTTKLLIVVIVVALVYAVRSVCMLEQATISFAECIVTNVVCAGIVGICVLVIKHTDDLDRFDD